MHFSFPFTIASPNIAYNYIALPTTIILPPYHYLSKTGRREILKGVNYLDITATYAILGILFHF